MSRPPPVTPHQMQAVGEQHERRPQEKSQKGRMLNACLVWLPLEVMGELQAGTCAHL